MAITFELDFSKQPDHKKKGHSQKDNKFLKIVSEGYVSSAQMTDTTRFPFRFTLVAYVSLIAKNNFFNERTG